MRGVRANGEEISRLRKGLGITQLQLAERAGCDVKTARAAERGLSLDIFNLRRIATVLGAPFSDVTRGLPGKRSSRLRHRHQAQLWLEAFDATDATALATAFAPRGMLRVPGAPLLAEAGIFRGRHEIAGHFTSLFASYRVKRLMPARCSLHASDDYVHACGRVLLTRRDGAASCRVHVALAFRFDKTGIAELTVYFDTLAIYRLQNPARDK